MINPLFIGPIGPLETVLIILAVVLLFGADKIPELAKSVGQAKEKVKEGQKEAQKELEEIDEEMAEREE
jgi:sec-independent protein translocase protein TatA